MLAYLLGIVNDHGAAWTLTFTHSVVDADRSDAGLYSTRGGFVPGTTQ